MKVVTVELSPSVRRGEKLLVVGGRRRLSNSLSGLFPALKRAHPPRANGKVEQQVGVLHPPPSLPPLRRCVSEKQVDPLSAAWKREQNFARCLLDCLGRFVCTVEEFLCACSDSPALFERPQRFALKRLLINKSDKSRLRHQAQVFVIMWIC